VASLGASSSEAHEMDRRRSRRIAGAGTGELTTARDHRWRVASAENLKSLARKKRLLSIAF
jgi:hypothetical protein